MNKYKIHKMLSNVLHDIERNENDSKIVNSIRIIAEELKDPFASSIDEFLIEKESKEHPQEASEETLKEEATDYQQPDVSDEHPQDQSKDELKEESIDYQEPTKQENPQDQAEDEMSDEVIESGEDSGESEKDIEDKKDIELDESRSKQDELERKVEEETESVKDSKIESALKKLGSDIDKRGYPKIANIFIKASTTGIVETLNNLLMREFLIRDILENYAYLFTPETVRLAKQYKPKESILYLQRQIVSLNGKPTSQRLSIPAINPASADGVLELIKVHDRKIIAAYLAAIKDIEEEDRYLTLKIMFERIIQNRKIKSGV